MLKSLTIISSCLFVSSCAVVRPSSTWERVVNAPRSATGSGTLSAAYAEDPAEAVEWLANLNPQFRAKIRSTIPRNSKGGALKKPPGEIKDKAKA